MRALAALGLLLLAADARGELTGRVRGRVTADGAPVAADVTLSGPALVGGPRRGRAGADGRFDVLDLPPGSYTVAVALPGAAPITRRVEVRLGETAVIDIAWVPDLESVETIAIPERVVLTRPDSARAGATLTAGMLARQATGRRYQDVVPLVPGVLDNARDGPGRGGNPFIKGAGAFHNRFLIDGLDITDPVQGTFSANVAFDAIAAIEVMTAGHEADHGALGGVINMITRAGSDTFEARAALFLSPGALVASGPLGPGLQDGASPFDDGHVARRQAYQLSLGLGGPLVPGRLRLAGSFEALVTQDPVVPGPPLAGVQHAPSSSRRLLGHARLDLAIDPRQDLSLSLFIDPTSVDNLGGGNRNAYLGVAEQASRLVGPIAVLAWTRRFGERATATLLAGAQLQHNRTAPQGRLGEVDFAGCERYSPASCAYDPDRPRHVNESDGTVWYQGTVDSRTTRLQVRVEPTLAVRGRAAGRHELRVGLQAVFARASLEAEVPGGAQFLDSGGGPLEAGLCDPAAGRVAGCNLRVDTPRVATAQRGVGAGLFVTDRWTAAPGWLTVVPGLRVDHGRTYARDGRRVTSLLAVSPRLSAIADVTRDGHTVLSAHWGRSHETFSLLPAFQLDALETGVRRVHRFDRATGEFALSRVVGGPGGVRLDDGVAPPRSEEISLGARRQVARGAVAGLDYTHKRVSRLWDDVEVNQIWDPSGARVIGTVDGEPREVRVLTTVEDAGSTYHGVDLWAERRGPGLELAFGYTLSWTYGSGLVRLAPLGSLTQHDNPRKTRFFTGYLPHDARHNLQLVVGYRASWLGAGAILGHVTGESRTKTFSNVSTGARTDLRSPLGTTPGAGNDLSRISELRLPAVTSVDLRLTADLSRLARVPATIVLDVFNALGTRTPVDLQAGDLPTFGQVTDRQDPFRAQLGLIVSH
jgi:hypothetical protein